MSASAARQCVEKSEGTEASTTISGLKVSRSVDAGENTS